MTRAFSYFQYTEEDAKSNIERNKKKLLSVHSSVWTTIEGY